MRGMPIKLENSMVTVVPSIGSAALTKRSTRTCIAPDNVGSLNSGHLNLWPGPTICIKCSEDDDRLASKSILCGE